MSQNEGSQYTEEQNMISSFLNFFCLNNKNGKFEYNFNNINKDISKWISGLEDKRVRKKEKINVDVYEEQADNSLIDCLISAKNYYHSDAILSIGYRVSDFNEKRQEMYEDFVFDDLFNENIE